MGKGNNNIIPNSERTAEQRKAIARSGGIASGASRRRRKTMRELAEAFGQLPIEVTLPDGKKKKTDFDGAVIFSQYQQAIRKGNVQAASFLARLKGELEETVNVNAEPPVIVVRSEDEKRKLDSLGELGI